VRDVRHESVMRTITDIARARLAATTLYPSLARACYFPEAEL
jgi:hypothetical protein